MSSVVLATAGYDHTIRFWEATSGICYRTLQYTDSQVNRLEITQDKQLLAAAGNPHIRVFEVNSNNPQPIASYNGHTGNVTSVGFQKDSKWMFSGSEDGTVRIWDAVFGFELLVLTEHTDGVTAVEFSPDGSRLLSASRDGTVLVR